MWLTRNAEGFASGTFGDRSMYLSQQMDQVCHVNGTAQRLVTIKMG